MLKLINIIHPNGTVECLKLDCHAPFRYYEKQSSSLFAKADYIHSNTTLEISSLFPIRLNVSDGKVDNTILSADEDGDYYIIAMPPFDSIVNIFNDIVKKTSNFSVRICKLNDQLKYEKAAGINKTIQINNYKEEIKDLNESVFIYNSVLIGASLLLLGVMSAAIVYS